MDTTYKKKEMLEYLVEERVVAGLLDGRVMWLVTHNDLDDGVNVKTGELHAFDDGDRNLKSNKQKLGNALTWNKLKE